MDIGDTLDIFSKALLTLVKASRLINDRFFSDKFNKKLRDFTNNFLKFIVGYQSGNVAQYKRPSEAFLADINALSDIFSELKYLGIVNSSPLLLRSELMLLKIKLAVIKSTKYSLADNKKEDTQDVNKVIKSDLAVKKPKDKTELTESKKKILDYIRTYPNTRTKDIIYEFNSLSDRTVKRNLTDLIHAGFVKKRIDDKAVYYYLSDVQPKSGL